MKLSRRLIAALLLMACLLSLAPAAFAKEPAILRPYPEGYGGMYYKDGRLRIVVIALSQKEFDAIVKKIEPYFANLEREEYAYAWKRRGHTLRELEDVAAEIASHVERYGNTYANIPSGGSSPYTVESWNVNVAENRVDVGVGKLFGAHTAKAFAWISSFEDLHFYEVGRTLEGMNPVDTPQAEETTTVTATGTVNVRSGPGTNYGKLGQLKRGQEAAMTGKAGNWATIQWNGAVGYVSLDYLKVAGESAVAEDGADVVRAKATGSAAVRRGPNTAYEKLGTLKKGQEVIVTAQNGDWAKIRFGGGEGYVSMKYLSMDRAINVVEIVNTDGGIYEDSFTTGRVNVRMGPGTNYGKLGQLKKGTRIAIHSVKNGWAEITYAGALNGRAYVSMEYVEYQENNPVSAPNTAHKTASELMARWAGDPLKGTHNYPDDVGGISISEGQDKVIVTLVRNTKARQDAIRRLVSNPDDLVFYSCAYSYDQLDKAYREIADDMNEMRISAVGVGFSTENGPRMGFGPSGYEFRVVVTLGRAEDYGPVSKALAARYGDKVYVEKENFGYMVPMTD